MKMKRRNTTTALLCALIGLMIIAGFAIARPIPAPVEETEPVIEAVETEAPVEESAEKPPFEFPTWLGMVLSFIVGALGTIGINLAVSKKFAKELSEVFETYSRLGDTATVRDVLKEIEDVIRLFTDANPKHTIQAIGKTIAIKKGNRHIS